MDSKMCESKSTMKLDLSQPTMPVTVGENKTPFYIHKEVLIKSSQWFEAVFRPEWNNANTPMHISDVTVETFSQFAQWAYSGQLNLVDPTTDIATKMKEVHASSGDEGLKNWVYDQYDNLVSLAIFADQKVCSTALTNSVVDAICLLSDECHMAFTYAPYLPAPDLPRNSTIIRAYAELPSTCLVRTVFAHMVGHWYGLEDLREAANDWMPVEMAVDLMLLYRKIGEKSYGGRCPELPSMHMNCGSTCLFHVHEKGEKCARRGHCE